MALRNFIGGLAVVSFSRLFGRVAGLAAVAALSLAGLAMLAPAAQAQGYTFNGLEWGSSPAEAAKALRAKGFKVSKPKIGPATEYVEMDAWLDIRKIDRGKRLRATGKYLGEKVELDLVFGFNDRLERINMRTPLWDGTQKGGKKMTKIGDKLVAHFEGVYGTAYEKRNPFGFVDTARWNRGADGSHMEMYLRGTEGFMFYPDYTTVLNITFWNGRYSASPAAIAAAKTDPAYLASSTKDLSKTK